MNSVHAANLARLNPAKPKRNGDRWAQFNTFIDVTMRDLKRGEIAVWVYLFRHTRKGVVSASVRQVSESTGLTPRNAHAAIRGLEDKGLVEVVRTGKLNKGGSIYRTHCIP